MSKPSIFFIPGSFCLPEFYNSVVEPVKAQGYDLHCLHLPSVGLKSRQGRDGEAPTMYDDAAFIAKQVEKLADERKEVILVGHSYGGTPVTQSTQALSVKERQQQGKTGGIVKIAYITSVVPALGQSAGAVLEAVPEEQRVQPTMDEKGWLLQTNLAATAAIAFNHLPEKEGIAWAEKFAQHSAASFGGELTHAGYKDIPVSYLLCEEDRCVLPEIQRAEIEMIGKESGRKVDVTSIKSDHCPNISATQETIDWILDIAKRF